MSHFGLDCLSAVGLCRCLSVLLRTIDKKKRIESYKKSYQNLERVIHYEEPFLYFFDNLTQDQSPSLSGVTTHLRFGRGTVRGDRLNLFFLIFFFVLMPFRIIFLAFLILE